MNKKERTTDPSDSKQSNKRSNNNKNKSNSRGKRQYNSNSKNNHQKRNNRSNKNQPKKGRQSSGRWTRHRISTHFMKRDFDSREKDCGACSSNLRISMGLVGIIEAIRSYVNKRVDIVTGYYCPDCRDRQFGVKRNHHHMGIAADIKVEGMDSIDLFLLAETYSEIKGLGLNLIDGHVHIDTRKGDEREVWVETESEIILLTDENRAEYIPVTKDTPKRLENPELTNITPISTDAKTTAEVIKEAEANQELASQSDES
jgi:uncharacterized protein YcbK (DUF882 family)